MSDIGNDITKELERIRSRLGIPLANDFRIPPRLVEEMIDAKTLAELFDEESRLLIRNGVPVYAYIRDHSVGKKHALANPKTLRKLHFTMCKTLRDMEERGFSARYQITNRDSGKYLIELRNREEREANLHPCQNCLDELRYKNFSFDDNHMSSEDREKIVIGFSPKEAMLYISDYAAEFKRQTEGWRRDIDVAGYPANWGAISHSYRHSQNFTCERNSKHKPKGCGVNLKDFPHLTDCHHVNHVKSECHDDNLCCLCEECHANLHPHYNPPEEHLDIIRQVRKTQGLG